MNDAFKNKLSIYNILMKIGNLELIIYTDGSCYGNGKVDAVAGYGIHFPNNELPDISAPLKIGPFTNNRAELMAIKMALIKVIKYEKIHGNKFTKIKIHTDSTYSLQSITKWADTWVKNDWKKGGKDIKNRDIIEPTYELYKYYQHKIEFIHVKAHTKGNDYQSTHNDIVDKLANKGTQEACLIKKTKLKLKNKKHEIDIYGNINKVSKKKRTSKKTKERVLKINFIDINK